MTEEDALRVLPSFPTLPSLPVLSAQTVPNPDLSCEGEGDNWKMKAESWRGEQGRAGEASACVSTREDEGGATGSKSEINYLVLRGGE